MRNGKTCVGAAVTFGDATATEALCNYLDFIWLDMEHVPYSLETVQAHIMATKGSSTAPIVRVAWNDPNIIKPVRQFQARTAGFLIAIPTTWSADSTSSPI